MKIVHNWLSRDKGCAIVLSINRNREQYERRMIAMMKQNMNNNNRISINKNNGRNCLSLRKWVTE